MIVSVFRERELAPRVRLYELEEIQAPLRDLRERGGMAIEALELPIWGVLSGRDADEDLWARAAVPQPLHLRIGDDDLQVNGLLAVDDWWTALTFLRDHWQTGSHPAIDSLVDAWRAGDPQAPMRLEFAIQAASQRAHHIRARSRRRGRRRVQLPSADAPPLMIGAAARELEWSTWDGSVYIAGSGQTVLPTHSSTTPVLAAEVEVTIGNRAIRRWQLLVATDDWDKPRHEHPASYWLFDGRKGRFLRRLDDADSEAPAHLLRFGRLQAAFPLDVMPQTHLVPRALVRVPSLEEAEAGMGDLDAPVPHPLLDRPAIVRDSRSPIKIPDDIPVVDDPSIGCWLIARTRAGVFLPQDGVRSATGLELGDEGAWAVLCEPRR